MDVLLLLAAQVAFIHATKAAPAFPQVFPSSQQHFAHDAFNISCEGLQGLTGWRVMRTIRGVTKTCAATWETSSGPCLIETAYPEMDTGKYWCVQGAKEISAVNITVTAGPVILESPVLPVMEGDAVTLSCRKKQPSINFTADFYKDGSLMERNSTGNFTINSVSTSNQGLYRCTTGAQESPESWLIVSSQADEDEEPQDEEEPQPLLLICIGVCVFLFVLLLLVGLLLCRKRQILTEDAPNSASTHLPISTPQTVSNETCGDDPFQSTYAVSNETCEDDPFRPTYAAVTITKYREEKVEDESSFMPVYHTLSLDNV